MSQPNKPTTPPTPPPDIEPILDAPNRLEIDPADIPPSERSTDPNVDQRTKIPVWVDPADMAPQEKRPRPQKKKP
jgi:hypothetical protein